MGSMQRRTAGLATALGLLVVPPVSGTHERTEGAVPRGAPARAPAEPLRVLGQARRAPTAGRLRLPGRPAPSRLRVRFRCAGATSSGPRSTVSAVVAGTRARTSSPPAGLLSSRLARAGSSSRRPRATRATTWSCRTPAGVSTRTSTCSDRAAREGETASARASASAGWERPATPMAVTCTSSSGPPRAALPADARSTPVRRSTAGSSAA